MSTLEPAITIAAVAHRGQRRRNGEPFILHVIRVVARVESATGQIIAALHDVVEKTS